ncbi:hypothetical protein [Rahnella aceris]|jgi:hypothetical protein|uniref:hypothetical protein n=1 Tax=Rahnella sp. (strain Y9602) TaxID=2703885 RepID=UPI00141FBA6A|nr:hypothetical protein [Rahnella aceris]NIA89954.1 hypothetical protein [Rahnella aceris]
MLEGYFNDTSKSVEEAITKSQRLLAVQAALEIAKASASSPTSSTAAHKMKFDLENAADQIKNLADAIQESLK